MSSVLITGANGFLGSELTRQAMASGFDVLASDIGRNGVVPGVRYCVADILNPASLGSIFQGRGAVIHAAGLAHVFNKAKAAVAPFSAVNEVGTLNVARAAATAGVRHMVLISSVSVYGHHTLQARSECDPCHPDEPYADSKWQAELRAGEVAANSGMQLTIIRLATLYGEEDPGNIARLMRVIDRRRFIWVGNGSNRKSLIYRADAGKAILRAVQADGDRIRIYNVAGPPCSVRELVEGLASALGRHLPAVRIPASLALGLTGLAARLSNGHGPFVTAKAAVEKWLADDVCDGSKFSRTFGFFPQVVLREGLRREVAWYRQHSGQLCRPTSL